MQCHKHICSGEYANNVKWEYICLPGHIVDCIGFMWGICTDVVVSYVYMKLLAPAAYIWHLMGILIFGMYIDVTCLSHDGDGVINDIVAFLLLRWLLRGII